MNICFSTTFTNFLLMSANNMELPANTSILLLVGVHTGLVNEQNVVWVSDFIKCFQTNHLFFRFNLTYREVSRATGIPINTVKSHVFRARQSLRRALAGSTAGSFHEL